nr:hypothetical protein [Yoonia sp.]
MHKLPVALKIGAGKINAVSGEKWGDGLSKDPQNYVVLPNQPWLDGFNVEKGKVRQFVAMPLGQSIRTPAASSMCGKRKTIWSC